MKNTGLVRAYARAVIELGEKNKIDVAKELTILTELINGSNALENLLFLDVFTIEEKEDVLKAIFKKAKLSSLVSNFILFLSQESRLSDFPSIYKEVIVIDDDKKGFLRGVIEGSEDGINSTDQKILVKYIENRLGKKATFEYKQNENITAGYRVTVEDLQLDATVDNKLEEFKRQFN